MLLWGFQAHFCDTRYFILSQLFCLKAGVRDFGNYNICSFKKYNSHNFHRLIPNFWSTLHFTRWWNFKKNLHSVTSLLYWWNSRDTFSGLIWVEMGWNRRSGSWQGLSSIQEMSLMLQIKNNLVFRGAFQNRHCRKMNKVPHCRFNVLCIVVYQLPKSFQTLWSASQNSKHFSVWLRKSENRMLEKSGCTSWNCRFCFHLKAKAKFSPYFQLSIRRFQAF